MHSMIFEKIEAFLKEDAPFGDITTSCFPNKNIKADILVRERAFICGLDFMEDYFIYKGINIKKRFKHGWSGKNTPIFSLTGSAREILFLERTILNLLARMIGISTKTRKIIEKIKGINPHIVIAATRKTTPGLRWFEKQAISCAGGDTHRFSLSDMVMVKDNHIKLAGSVTKALEYVQKHTGFSKKIEVEIETKEQLLSVIDNLPDILLLDNKNPQQVKELLEILDAKAPGHKVKIEVSGGITERNVASFASLPIDIISMGCLTHSVKNTDVSMEVNI